MFDRLKNPFRREKRRELTDEEYQRFYDLKLQGLERVLGKMHDLVGHSIIPFQAGGAVDMYYFPHALPGTGFATMELIEAGGRGPKPSRIGVYELVAFTRHHIGSSLRVFKSMKPEPGEQLSEEDAAFLNIHKRICYILTMVGKYSYYAVLNPGDTMEVPQAEGEPNLCLVCDEYISPNGIFTIGRQKYGLLLVMEVFRSEMEYARKFGSRWLFDKLKAQGYYPYSDLDRPAVV